MGTLSQVAAAKLAKGQRCTERRRPDYVMRQVAWPKCSACTILDNMTISLHCLCFVCLLQRLKDTNLQHFLGCCLQQREAELLARVEELAPANRVRPSLLRPLVSAVGFSLGAASSVLPKQASSAISGKKQPHSRDTRYACMQTHQRQPLSSITSRHLCSKIHVPLKVSRVLSSCS